MLSGHYYHKTTKRIVATFGSLFNKIVTSKPSGSGLAQLIRVPIAYGPRAKWLTRIQEEADLTNRLSEVAIRLPRMSFEITSMVPDENKKLSRVNTWTADNSNGNGGTRIRQMTPYRIGMQLNIMAKIQDDALQILEQIIPYFNPDYTVSVFGLNGVNEKVDVPITLQSVSIQDDYEGDGLTRRTIIYTLDFELRATYYGPTLDSSVGLIRTTNVHFSDSSGYLETATTGIPNPADTEDSFTVIARTTEFIADSTLFDLTVSDISGTFQIEEDVYSTLTGTYGRIKSISGNNFTVLSEDGVYISDEFIVGKTSGATAKISSAAL